MAMNTPNRQTSEDQLNQFNIWMRSQPWFIEWHRQRGLNPSGNGNRKLSDGEQAQIESLMRANGVQLPNGMHVDSGGSLNQKNRLARNIGIGAAVTGAALTGLGAAGIGPMSGLFASTAPIATSTATTAGLGAVPELGVSAIPSVLGTSGVAASSAPLTFGSIATGATKAPSMFSRIGSALRNPQVIGAAGQMAGRASQAAAENRGAQTAAQMDYDRMGLERDQIKLQAEESARKAQSDAINKAVYGQYLANWQPSVPEDFKPYAGNIQAPSEEARAAGRLLYDQANELMKSGKYTDVNPQLTPFSEYPTRPGTMERVGNYVAPALTFYGLYDQLFGGR